VKEEIIYQETLQFCEVTIFPDYLYVVMNEGITVVPEYNDILINLTNTYYQEKDFVYITHRIHSYSVNPTIYLETARIENLKGFAVVALDSEKEVINTKVEKLFFNKPFALFDSLEDAIHWKNTLLYSD
tara:strand:- start:175 stop:561 length:387 start_codon:yes stop_codon:yes gene_type:complete